MHEFDRNVEALFEQYYDNGSRGGYPSLPPGFYFRMGFIDYFEGIASYRGSTSLEQYQRLRS